MKRLLDASARSAAWTLKVIGRAIFAICGLAFFYWLFPPSHHSLIRDATLSDLSLAMLKPMMAAIWVWSVMVDRE